MGLPPLLLEERREPWELRDPFEPLEERREPWEPPLEPCELLRPFDDGREVLRPKRPGAAVLPRGWQLGLAWVRFLHL